MQDSEVRPLWHCRIWPWPQWTIVEQYVSEILIQPCFDHLVVSCVDTSTIGLSLYSRDHLQTSFLKNFNSLQTWNFICCNSWTNTDVHTARHQILDNVSAGTFRLGLSGLKKPCSFNSILVVTNPNFFAWVSAAVCTDKNSFFRHWQCMALPFPHYTSLFHIRVAKPAETFDFSLLYKLVSHSCGKACRNVWRQIRSERIGSQTSLTLSNLAVATLNNRVAVPFKTKMFQPCFDHRVV